MKAAELCAGYGGLAKAIEEVFIAKTVWVSEFEEAPSKILAHHWPEAHNYGDMTKINWYGVETVEVLGGGTPCQDLSAAGARRGMTEGTRSNLWVNMREAIAIIRPTWVVWENVRGAYSAEASSDLEFCPGCMGDATDRGTVLRALGRVLGDLSDLGYDAEWRGLRAADVGACHARYRVFVLAKNRDGGRGRGWTADARGSEGPQADLAAGWAAGPGTDPAAPNSHDIGDYRGGEWPEQDGRGESENGGLAPAAHGERSSSGGTAAPLMPTPTVGMTMGGSMTRSGSRNGEPLLPGVAKLFPTPKATDGYKGGPNQRGSSGDLMMPSAVTLLPRVAAHDSGNTPEQHLAKKPGRVQVTSLQITVDHLLPTCTAQDTVGEYENLWYSLADRSPYWITEERPGIPSVDYGPAITRWEQVMGRVSPPPSIPDGRGGKFRLNPAFTEWMMGMPEGWITSKAIGISRNEQLKACGNGVVPQQAVAALRDMLAAFQTVEVAA